MNLQKAKILLDKINGLHKSMSADSKNISSIEKDLMRSYVQQLYEAFLDLPDSVRQTEASKVEVIRSRPKVVEKAPPPAPAPKPVAKPIPPPPPPPPAPKKTVPPPPAPPVQKPERAAPVTPPPPVPKSPPPPLSLNPEVEELFDVAAASNDLSERLSQTPIKDIKKAMGLNERIFTMNELFGGDQAAFDASMDMLNSFTNFDQAKKHLAGTVAPKFKWTAKANKKKAKTFIKLVRRRYG